MSGVPRWRILPGHSFDLGGGKVAGAGEVIELEADVAAMHAHRIEPVDDAAVQTPAPGGARADDDDQP